MDSVDADTSPTDLEPEAPTDLFSDEKSIITGSLWAEYDMGHSGLGSTITFTMTCSDNWVLEEPPADKAAHNAILSSPPYEIRIWGFDNPSSVQTREGILHGGEEPIEIGEQDLSILRSQQEAWVGYGFELEDYCIFFFITATDDINPVQARYFDEEICTMIRSFQIVDIADTNPWATDNAF